MPQEVLMLMQHVALYLLKQSPVLRVIKLAVWVVPFQISIYMYIQWGSGGGRGGCFSIFSWLSWPNTAYYTSSAVFLNFAWDLQSLCPWGLKNHRIKVLRFLFGKACYKTWLWSLHILVWISGSMLVLSGRMTVESPMSLVLWDICTA
jgi:hypothetical protein